MRASSVAIRKTWWVQFVDLGNDVLHFGEVCDAAMQVASGRRARGAAGQGVRRVARSGCQDVLLRDRPE
eukprot:3404340-Pyramimonas_sp.AAC.1